MKEKMTVSEVKEICRRAMNCIVFQSDDIMSGGYSTCPFCDKCSYYGDTKKHKDDCLVYKIEKIVRCAEIVDG